MKELLHDGLQENASHMEQQYTKFCFTLSSEKQYNQMTQNWSTYLSIWLRMGLRFFDLAKVQ